LGIARARAPVEALAARRARPPVGPIGGGIVADTADRQTAIVAALIVLAALALIAGVSVGFSGAIQF
jgi:hypothetical protein